ncbi:PREDICTED: ras-like protein family member 10B [Polistes dominula]|uniref:Ras-like protein family member 10B n=1 Tax=Polistes dominula TaxID=743375 RepID=A0ABM1IW58_POLDO|nr:PREDICTED: ras-like protein family member 10B [Polistes dominula]
MTDDDIIFNRSNTLCAALTVYKETKASFYLVYYRKGRFDLESAEGKRTKTASGRRRRSLPPPKKCPLDLDYLERRAGETISCENVESGSKEEESPADSLDRVKVVFLGAPGVGKTSIIRQFVWSEFSEEYRPTKKRETFYPSVVLADRLYELKITDVPTIPFFPISSHLEWTDFRYYGLRSATAYVLVFDLSNQDTFQYIRKLREQILEARDMRSVSLLVVGNKQDELSSSVASSARYKNIVNVVRKHWRCGYVECSARFNCRVVQVFRELMKSIQAVEGRPPSPIPAPSSSSSSQPLRSHQHDNAEKCILL